MHRAYAHEPTPYYAQHVADTDSVKNKSPAARVLTMRDKLAETFAKERAKYVLLAKGWAIAAAARHRCIRSYTVACACTDSLIVDSQLRKRRKRDMGIGP